MIKELIGVDTDICIDTARLRPAKSEVDKLLSDSTKLKAVSTWTSKYDLKEWSFKNHSLV